MITVLFSAREDIWPNYETRLPEALAEEGLAARVVREADPAEVDWIVYAPNGGLTDFSPFTKLKGVQSLWAGVEQIVGNPTLKVPLARMVDPGMTEGMVEWVTGHVLRHHLGMDADIKRTDGQWVRHVAPLARERTVAMLGLGALGTACARALAGLNFDVRGWSRSEKRIDGITCAHGDEGLAEVLREAEIAVLLLPDTPATTNLLDAVRLALMPNGAVIINPGRGPLIDDDALLEALDEGRIGHATLDVFREEPLPAGHPFWHHPRVTVTPHIASETRPVTAVRSAAANIARAERGEGLLHTVDFGLGY
ncbi:2-hydroxyacid dehydrogenase [Pontivivens ytuae]|uniref:Glyoxylate/hydroxypyruvate reductase A n=1 Tax=Pontivivens ytuae TaxID=2789856 RepID=A0A7S9QDW0_9RHOB|nr:glyoxylate/hydroxypyruvate reductase A [Pontivivens ytuae]QPH55698.1 glyoxylate/hydroxypyruvate reductase A [Pontivivens ytuae]